MTRRFENIIVHCSASDVEAHDNISVIKKWHVEENGWKDVGYHYFIKSNGDLQYGRPIQEVGAHCKGNNLTSIGVCLHGKTVFKREQFITLADLVAHLFQVFNINDVKGHSYYDKNKPYCPGFNVYNKIKLWRPDLEIK